MNRIILIGNGFDLAHEMKTTYKDFLDNYWEEVIALIKKSPQGRKFENDEVIINKSPSGFLSGNSYNDLKATLKDFKEDIIFKNKFLEKITEKSNIESWVDVENEYYSLLKDIYKKNGNALKNYSISQLNLDFQRIKDLLREYLTSINENFKRNYQWHNRTEQTIGYKLFELLNPRDFSEDALNEIVEIEYKNLEKEINEIKQGKLDLERVEGSKQALLRKLLNSYNPRTTIRRLLQSPGASNDFNMVPEETLFLNFNYTFTEDFYTRPKTFNHFDDFDTKVSVNHIHGSINKYEKSPIIFGFGDELDDEYSNIEKLNNNEYLENIKSINYLESSNYKSLLEFINSQRYQIFIIGHSCGISDRTLLNTMFEHINCSSIKIFYHQKSEEEDNYSDIVRNISRNFNDKASMRDRVVNKQYSQKLL
ncbi:AbiH family protein [Salinimicrobium sediminilitoris]|uniref:AbiH family protein n=1 Tax=Salinimicrobium sediminilitoris TaxID=2876715 RepID=UPI001E2CC72A|nr:AbiH family protein [Salinimicrobium sediminilitoris]MCC8358929.1 bacteriophage abortive infection AbiH family protein [Salinimicrobium sediminilitoris]